MIEAVHPVAFMYLRSIVGMAHLSIVWLTLRLDEALGRIGTLRGQLETLLGDDGD